MKGKDKCDFLKALRKKIADDNDIVLHQKDCKHEGDCLGTCPLCDSESAYILDELKKKNAIRLSADGKYCKENVEINLNTLLSFMNNWQDYIVEEQWRPTGDISTDEQDELLPPPPQVGEVSFYPEDDF